MYIGLEDSLPTSPSTQTTTGSTVVPPKSLKSLLSRPVS